MSPTSIVTFLEVIDYRKQPDFIIRIFSRTNVVVFLMIYYFCVLVFSKRKYFLLWAGNLVG